MEIWDKFLGKIKDRVGKTTFETWFSPIKLKKWSESGIVLEVPDEFFQHEFWG